MRFWGVIGKYNKIREWLFMYSKCRHLPNILQHNQLSGDCELYFWIQILILNEVLLVPLSSCVAKDLSLKILIISKAVSPFSFSFSIFDISFSLFQFYRCYLVDSQINILGVLATWLCISLTSLHTQMVSQMVVASHMHM